MREDSEDPKPVVSNYLRPMGYTLVAALVGAAIGGAEDRMGPSTTRARAALRKVLKDDEQTDRVIHLLTEDPRVVQEFMDDPDMLKNLKKLTVAMEQRVALDEKVEGLQEIEATRPKKNWAREALMGKNDHKHTK